MEFRFNFLENKPNTAEHLSAYVAPAHGHTLVITKRPYAGRAGLICRFDNVIPAQTYIFSSGDEGVWGKAGVLNCS